MTRKEQELELNKALEQEYQKEQEQVTRYQAERQEKNNYMIVTSYDIIDLEDKVSILLKKGWTVSGGVALTEYGLAQAMVRETNPSKIANATIRAKDIGVFNTENRKVEELVSRV